MQVGAQGLLASWLAQPLLGCLLFFGVIILCMEIGRLIGRGKGEAAGASTVNGAIFAIFGLILALSFSGAASRFDERRDLIVQEANSVGTAVLRIDLLPADAQPLLRDKFTQYVDARIAAYAASGDPTAFRAGLNRANAISLDIWNLSVAAASRPDAAPAANMLLLPAINEMIDLSSSRAFMTLKHPPIIIRFMMIALAMGAALLSGIGFGTSGSGGRLHELAFALVITATIFITVDLEYPLTGFIRIDDFSNAVVNFSRGS